jgi:hypothetical protein
MAVQISGGKLTIRGGFVTRTVNVSEIRAITMASGDNLRVRPSWVPQIDLTDGKSVLIHDFDCGPADRPPDPELAASLDEFQLLLDIRADDTGRHESHQIDRAAK